MREALSGTLQCALGFFPFAAFACRFSDGKKTFSEFGNIVTALGSCYGFAGQFQGVPVSTLLKAGLVIAAIFVVVLIIALTSAYLYGELFVKH